MKTGAGSHASDNDIDISEGIVVPADTSEVTNMLEEVIVPGETPEATKVLEDAIVPVETSETTKVLVTPSLHLTNVRQEEDDPRTNRAILDGIGRTDELHRELQPSVEKCKRDSGSSGGTDSNDIRVEGDGSALPGINRGDGDVNTRVEGCQRPGRAKVDQDPRVHLGGNQSLDLKKVDPIKGNITNNCGLELDLTTLREKSDGMKSVLITWGNHTKQVFFDESNAIPGITRKIKEVWSILRKIYWLQINGRHESQIHEWPRESSVVVKVRGLGEGEWDDDDDVHDFEDGVEFGPSSARKKFPKGKVKVYIGGEILSVMNNITFRELCRRNRKRLTSDCVWTRGGRPISAFHKLRYYFSPEMDPAGWLAAPEISQKADRECAI
jgi:hypothetical protein